MSGSLAERTFLDTYLFFSLLVGCIIYPVAEAWVWHGGWLQVLEFHDHAGSGVVHITGGVAGLVGTWILGPRLGAFETERKGGFERGHDIIKKSEQEIAKLNKIIEEITGEEAGTITFVTKGMSSESKIDGDPLHGNKSGSSLADTHTKKDSKIDQTAAFIEVSKTKVDPINELLSPEIVSGAEKKSSSNFSADVQINKYVPNQSYDSSQNKRAKTKVEEKSNSSTHESAKLSSNRVSNSINNKLADNTFY